MNALQRRYLARIGIPSWELRRAVAGSPPPANATVGDPADEAASAPVAAASALAAVTSAPAAAASAPGSGDGQTVWTTLEAEVRACTKCMLHRGRKQTVFGVGHRNASLMVVGEAPGGEEDRQGEPFVGPAGQLLNAMLRSIGFAREDVYIANVLKCRPPKNRDPSGDEIGACSGYLERQIALTEPRALLAVGRIAAQWLLQSNAPIGRLRGAVHRYGERPLVVTYHPAYLLRTPLAKAKSWQDLCMIRDTITAGP